MFRRSWVIGQSYTICDPYLSPSRNGWKPMASIRAVSRTSRTIAVVCRSPRASGKRSRRNSPDLTRQFKRTAADADAGFRSGPRHLWLLVSQWRAALARKAPKPIRRLACMSMLNSFVHHAESLIRASGALPGADDACLRSIAEAASWLSIRGGETLFAQGDPSNSIYIVINGLLVATVRKSSGEEAMLDRIGPGEVIGEMGAVEDEPRSATVRALRTSEPSEALPANRWKNYASASNPPQVAFRYGRSTASQCAGRQEHTLSPPNLLHIT